MNIFQSLKLENLSDEKKTDLLAQVAVPLSKRLLLYAYEKLAETDRLEFEKLLNQEDEVKINAFLKTKLPHLDQIAEIEALKLIEEVKRQY